MNINEGWGMVNYMRNNLSTHTVYSFSYGNMYRALSWSHDAWALIALIDFLSAILVLSLLWKHILLVLLIRMINEHQYGGLIRR